MMEYAFTGATWFWLLVPMPLVVIFSIISYVRHQRREGEN